MVLQKAQGLTLSTLCVPYVCLLHVSHSSCSARARSVSLSAHACIHRTASCKHMGHQPLDCPSPSGQGIHLHVQLAHVHRNTFSRNMAPRPTPRPTPPHCSSNAITSFNSLIKHARLSCIKRHQSVTNRQTVEDSVRHKIDKHADARCNTTRTDTSPCSAGRGSRGWWRP